MKILDKYIELIEKGYCSDCNELNCIDIFPQEKIVQEIKQLQQENQQLKKQKADVVEYINFLYIINQNVNGKFSDTLWGKEILELLGEIE